MKFSNAQEVIAYLYGLPHLHPKNDLSYIKKILTILGEPQKQIKTIHVTGTNGKGSTSYYLSKLLQEAGQRTGLFVSPYIHDFNERIQLNGREISDQDLVAAANQVAAAITKARQQNQDFSLVTFEYEVAMAFCYFAQEKCDYAVIEVGIGGKHDKTNVIQPEVSIITTIGLDHEKIIGPSLADIAHEKSGIIKAKRPVVLGNIPAEVLPIILAKAKAEQAPVFQLGHDFKIKQQSQLVYQDHKQQLKISKRPLVEAYDAAIAIKAFSLLALPLKTEQEELAIAQTKIPGRYQFLQKTPAIILDGAHNIQAMTHILDYVHGLQAQKGGQVYVLITMMKDKDLSQVFSLFKTSDQILLTSLAYPRVARLADFPATVQKKYPYLVDCHSAYLKLKQKLQPNDILLVTGSFYLVAEILNWQRSNK